MLKFNKILLSFLMFVYVIFLYSYNSNVKDSTTKSESKINATVSIVPEETFVKEVGGDSKYYYNDTLRTSRRYAPTTDIMERLSNSSIYFSIGVPTENANILPKIGDFNLKK